MAMSIKAALKMVSGLAKVFASSDKLVPFIKGNGEMINLKAMDICFHSQTK
jgi:hypothetical protein